MMGGVGYGRVDVRIERMRDYQKQSEKNKLYIISKSSYSNDDENNTDSIILTNNCIYNNDDKDNVNRNVCCKNSNLHIS